jgi:hypothetical protein
VDIQIKPNPCPNCKEWLFLPIHQEVEIEVLCPRCRRAFQYLSVTVNDTPESVVITQAKETVQYLLQVSDALGYQKQVNFVCCHSQKIDPILPGDQLELLYFVSPPISKKRSLENEFPFTLLDRLGRVIRYALSIPQQTLKSDKMPVQVIHTKTGQVCTTEAAQKLRLQFHEISVLTAFWVVVLSPICGPSAGFSLIAALNLIAALGLPAAVLALGTAYVLDTIYRKRRSGGLDRLLQEQIVLSRLFEISECIESLQREKVACQQSKNRAARLHLAIQKPGLAEHYGQHQPTLTQVTPLLEQHSTATEEMLSQYQQLQEILQTEFEALRLVGAMPEGTSIPDMAIRNELEAFESRQDEALTQVALLELRPNSWP